MDNHIYFALIAAALAIYAMVDISMRHFPLKSKMIWFPIIILIPFIGPLLYYVRRKRLMKLYDKGAAK